MTPARRIRRFRAAALVVLGLLAGACVNPFKPADPEPPDTNGVVEDFRTPDDVLATIALALQSRSTNGANAYLHAYAESTVAGDRAFRAYYDGNVRDQWQGDNRLTAPEPWDLNLERNVHTYISGIRPSYGYQFQWLNDPDSQINEDPTLADTVLWHKQYKLFASSPEGNAEIIAIGFADLSFQKKAGRWSIFRWVDRVDPSVGVTPVATDQRTMSWRRLESLSRK